jgi:hypothetical protein
LPFFDIALDFRQLDDVLRGVPPVTSGFRAGSSIGSKER